jgi:hypothetical protein
VLAMHAMGSSCSPPCGCNAAPRGRERIATDRTKGNRQPKNFCIVLFHSTTSSSLSGTCFGSTGRLLRILLPQGLARHVGTRAGDYVPTCMLVPRNGACRYMRCAYGHGHGDGRVRACQDSPCAASTSVPCWMDDLPLHHHTACPGDAHDSPYHVWPIPASSKHMPWGCAQFTIPRVAYPSKLQTHALGMRTIHHTTCGLSQQAPNTCHAQAPPNQAPALERCTPAYLPTPNHPELRQPRSPLISSPIHKPRVRFHSSHTILLKACLLVTNDVFSSQPNQTAQPQIMPTLPVPP